MLRRTPLKAKTGFKRKTYEQITVLQRAKKAPPRNLKSKPNTKVIKKLKKPKLPSISSLEKKVWELCKQVTRKYWCNDDGTAKCFTCDKYLTNPSDMHTAHWRKKSILPMTHKYDIQMLKICCPTCNKWLNGNEGEYTLRLVRLYGEEWVLNKDKEWKQSKQHLKGSADNRIFLQNLIVQYNNILDS